MAQKAEKIENRKVANLKPYEGNARRHTDEHVQQIVSSIKEWGWTIPILIDEDDRIIAGHGRLDAAKVLGYSTVPVIVARDWTEDQKRAYTLADNKLTLNSEWDYDVLKGELEALLDSDLDIDLTGFGAEELDALLQDQSGFGDGSGDGEENGAPTRSSEGYTEFSVVLTVENKSKLMSTLNELKAEHELEGVEEAIMFLVDNYGSS